MSKFFHNPRERGRFMRFAVVGLIGAVVDFGTFNLLTSLLSLPAVLASVCSFGAAIVSNFTWNRYWTYPDSRSKQLSNQLVQFGITSLIGLMIRTPLFAFIESPLRDFFAGLRFPNMPFFEPDFLGHNVALAIAVIVVMFWNFFVNRFWTYSDVE